jgi:hypothetical protein
MLEIFQAVLSVCGVFVSRSSDSPLSQIPHEVQQVMSAEVSPSLAGVIPCFEHFMYMWERLGKMEPKLTPYTDEGLKWATKYYNRMDNSRAYVVAMRKTHSSSLKQTYTYMVVNSSEPYCSFQIH